MSTSLISREEYENVSKIIRYAVLESLGDLANAIIKYVALDPELIRRLGEEIGRLINIDAILQKSVVNEVVKEIARTVVEDIIKYGYSMGIELAAKDIVTEIVKKLLKLNGIDVFKANTIVRRLATIIDNKASDIATAIRKFIEFTMSPENLENLVRGIQLYVLLKTLKESLEIRVIEKVERIAVIVACKTKEGYWSANPITIEFPK